jgi:hypothetical protein
MNYLKQTIIIRIRGLGLSLESVIGGLNTNLPHGSGMVLCKTSLHIQQLPCHYTNSQDSSQTSRYLRCYKKKNNIFDKCNSINQIIGRHYNTA